MASDIPTAQELNYQGMRQALRNIRALASPSMRRWAAANA